MEPAVLLNPQLDSNKPLPTDMADGSHQQHSDTLAPPRKSVELEDPGAHELCKDFHNLSCSVLAVYLLTAGLIYDLSLWR